ncbi:MAG TPA: CHASE3 domain-containing protein, partial [Verrucomicrobiae bacterium]|nr:CHASE3 domain-containing protein [Verrucomicrobiae bacterium]
MIFAIAATLLGGSMAVTFRVGRLSIEAEGRMAHQLQAMNHLPDLASDVKDAETGQRGFIITGDEAYLQPYTDSLSKIKTQVGDLQKLVQAGEISKEELERTSDLIQQKMAELAKTIQLRRDKGFVAALEVIRNNRGKDLMDQIRVNIDHLRKSAQANYEEATQRADRISNLRTATFLIVTLVNLGFLAWAFRRIARQDWLQTGQARLSERMAGDQPLRELGDKALAFLAEYLDAQVGAVYIEDGGAYQLVATYAVPSPQGLTQKFAPGEGLLGQAAKDHRPRVIHHVPEGYLSVGSGLGQSRPQRLMIAPTRVDNEVNGVVELGFFHPGYKADIEFLERVSEVVGVALRSAQYRTRLQELLEETQRQSEELQSQSEELRVSNEELEEQSRALKESQARLEQQQVELEQSNAQLEEQTQILETQKDDLSRAKIELEKQAAIVEQASRYKSDFLANMSHELRTPLNSS